MSKAFNDLFWATLECAPVPNKWNRLWGALQQTATSTLVCDLLPKVFEAAFKSMVFKEYSPEDLYKADPKVVEQLHYHAVNGKRLNNSMQFVTDADMKIIVVRCLVVSEVCRILTQFWLSCLKRNELNASQPPIFRLLDQRRSPVWAVMQYLAHLVFSEDGRGRLVFLWAKQCYASYPEFMEKCPDQVRLLRRALHWTSGMIFRRHYDYFMSRSLWILAIGDDDCHPDMIDLALARYMAASKCCMPPGLLRYLKSKGVTAEELCTKKWYLILRSIAKLLELTLADNECGHAFNNHSLDNLFASVAAKWINKESNLDEYEDATTCMPCAPIPAKRSRGEVSVRGLIKESLIQCMRKDNLPVDPFSASFHAELTTMCLGQLSFTYFSFKAGYSGTGRRPPTLRYSWCSFLFVS